MSRVILLFIACFAVGDLLAQKECSSTEYAIQLAARDTYSKQKIEAAESFMSGFRSEIFSGGNFPNSPSFSIPVITIPVVVHILYKDAKQNVSDDQVRRQLEVLNKAFLFQNADTSKIPFYFRDLAADCRIQFVLAKIAPNGKATSGIVRTNTWVTQYGIDDRIKFTNQGGDDAWDCNKYLNIWVGALAGGLAGYSSPVGGPANTDGVAIKTEAFGVSGGGTYGFGKTLVHEIGHWLGLRHIWGDASCGDDLVDDTPQQQTANRGCPGGIKLTCGNSTFGDMYMNYMDLVSDECMVMFTNGQSNRMRSVFAPGGPREAILHSDALTGTPLPEEAVTPGVVQTNSCKFRIFPNPVQKDLIIQWQDDLQQPNTEVIIVNQFGQMVKKIRLVSSRTSISLNGLPAGMYIVKGGGSMLKFLKQ